MTNFNSKREFYRDCIFKNRIIGIDISSEFRKELRELSTLIRIYITTHLYSKENTHKEFELNKTQLNSRTETLAHHLIQSFIPEKVSFEEVHQVGIELCEKILGGKYEYVLAMYTDKDHIHNHIIFNSIDIDKDKAYYSYYGSCMNIRIQSDRLCEEYGLSAIDQEARKESTKLSEENL